MSHSISVSIVIYELDLAMLRKTVDSLSIALETANKRGLLARGQATEITIVDNGSNRTSIEDVVFSIRDPDRTKIKVLSNDKNVGYGRAHNQAILSSRAEFHLILNPDVELHPESLAEGLGYFSVNPSTALLGPFGVDENNKPANLAKRYPTLMDLSLRGLAPPFVKRWFSKRLSHYEYADLDHSRDTQVTMLSGCMMLGRTDLLKQIGGFDPAFFLYFEDFDLSLRSSKLGAVVYAPTMKVTHHGGHAAKKGATHAAYFVSSAVKFFNKHGWRFL